MKILMLIFFVSFSALAATVIPFERDVPRLSQFSFMSSHNHDSLYYTTTQVGDAEGNLFSYGFNVQNIGPNEIVPTSPEGMDFASRDFSFVTDDGSRKENFLWVTDYNGSGSISDRFESMFIFFPRLNQMHIEEKEDVLLITLSTGEEVIFSKRDKTLVSGVLKEKPMAGKFAAVEYSGKGIVIRSDARASDPRLAKNVQVIKSGLKPCLVSASLFWTQEGFPKFKFVSDEDVYKMITQKCGSAFIP